MANELKGKVAIVTGATRNQGRAYAEMLAANGCANVVVHHRGENSRSEAEETANAVRAKGAEPLVFQADLTKVSEVRRMFDESDKRFGRLDILINNAGVVIKKPFTEITEEEYDRAFGINAKAAFFCMQEAARRISDGGRIINIGTSLLGATTGSYSVYAGSKAPLEDFTRALAKEIGQRGVTVNTVCPGPLNTSFFYPAETPDSIEFFKHMSVQNRLGEIGDVVPLIEFLVSPKGGWVTAQTIFVNGGFLAR
ncbi:MAG TPA: SDR family oxidoreductase [Bryobacteraceae bacterium]|nr:SDR family oxidoreductase [Bryobacteraceae bacterium]